MNPDGYRLTVIHSRLYYFALSPRCVSVQHRSGLSISSAAHTTWFNVTMADDVSRGLTLIELQSRAAFKGWSERWKDRRGTELLCTCQHGINPSSAQRKRRRKRSPLDSVFILRSENCTSAGPQNPFMFLWGEKKSGNRCTNESVVWSQKSCAGSDFP